MREPPPRCVVYVATSLDGYIARSDGGLDWLSAVQVAGEDYGYARFFEAIDTVVVGRQTYETALGFEAWPYAGKRCVVMTTQARSPRHDEEFFSGPPRVLVEQLADKGAKRIYVDGGNVIRQFVGDDLVTDVTVSLVPVLLGEGIPLFGRLGRDVRLDLVSSRSFQSGLVQIEYRVRERG
jgi:dihydrofolate reductase